MDSKKIYIFTLAAHGKGISGGDRIFIEFARHWSKTYPVTIFVWKEGYSMCQKQNLDSNIKFQVSNLEPWSKLGFVVNYIARIFEGIKLGLTLKLKNDSDILLYSASEFWMDSLPALFLKLRYSNVRWAAAWFQTAPTPLKGFSEENKQRISLSSLLYWLVQLPIKPLIAKFADFVLVNNEIEKKQFPKHDSKSKAIVVLGAVNLQSINKWKRKFSKLPKVFEAVFQGRFHPQKGVVELVEIWKRVVSKRPLAKLALIGDGPLINDVRFKIKDLRLEKNIKLFGYVFDGEEKYRIFSQSKVVVHPAFYDSGGMAAAEAMAFGLPCVGFNLNSYKYYYPKGMAKVKIGDLDSFADKILQLLSTEKLYKKISKEATQLINYKWSWEVRSRQILDQVLK